MIVRITILNAQGEEEVWLTGNNYKDWWMHWEDFLYKRTQWWCRQNRILVKRLVYGIVDVEYSRSKWISYGGLKSCKEEVFQDELNEEAKGLDKKPRKYTDMYFKEIYKHYEKAEDIYNRIVGFAGDMRPNYEEKKDLVSKLMEEDHKRREAKV